MTPLEIERKYLLYPCPPKHIFGLLDIPYKKETLEQYYLATEASPFTRYRQKGDKYFQTIKSGEGLVRQEREFEVSKEEYHAFKKSALGRIITKARYTFMVEGYTYELDQFHGSLEGLFYLEIEFPSEEKAQTFVLPSVFESLLVTEVTFDSAFNNAALSSTTTFPLPKLEQPYLFPQHKLFALTPFLSTRHAIDTMVFLLVDKIKMYHTLLQTDPKDVDALHQFRVTMRKLRTLIGEFKAFFDPQWFKEHKERLSSIMSQTNAKRDNDVALGDSSDFKAQLPIEDQAIMIDLEEKLKKNEIKLLEKLNVFLEDKILMDELNTLEILRKTTTAYTETATQPLVLISRQLLKHRLKKILKKGKHIDTETPINSYHILRIEFKKLRYLIELHAPIIDQKRYNETVESLKYIQTILGKVNDLHLQQKELVNFKKEIEKKEQKILQALDKKMHKEKKKYIEIFQDGFKAFQKKKKFYQKLFDYSPDLVP